MVMAAAILGHENVVVMGSKTPTQSAFHGAKTM
jgi:hypothetical protein